MTKIHVRLHGALRDKLPPENKGRTTLTLSEGATITAVLEQLALKSYFEVALNDEIVDNQDTALQEGDRLEIFRPASGGKGTVL